MIKFLRFIFLICFFLCVAVSLIIAKSPETKLLSAFLMKNTPKSMYIEKLSEITSNQLNIIVRSENKDRNKELQDFLESELSKLNYNDDIVKNTIEVYKNYPVNFITPELQGLLKAKKYNVIEENSLKMLYNPLGIYIASPDKDPYMFATDFVLSTQKHLAEKMIEKDGKVYGLIRFNCKNNSDVKLIKDIISKLELNSNEAIYLSGTPVHSYETQKRSNIEINIICLISFFMVSFLCKKYLKSYKVLVPVFVSILFGFLFGYTFSVLLFKKLHLLTFVFSTALIGIGFDYSLHYFLSKNNAHFTKSLFVSLLSTVIMFSMLLLSDIEILKQIAVFVSFGLIGIYSFVCLFLSLFDSDFIVCNDEKTFEVERLGFNKYRTILFAFLFVVIIWGSIRWNFDDSFQNLYKPTKLLMNAESVYRDVYVQKPVNFVIVEGKNIDDILSKEESITERLNNLDIKTLALSDFVSSTNKQKENIALVKELYKSRLNSYADFLPEETINKLLLKRFELYNPSDFVLNNKFLIDSQTAFIVAYSATADLKNLGFNSFSLTEEMTNTIKFFRHKCLRLIPFMFLILLCVLRIFYNFKQSVQLILPSFLGGIFSLCLISSLGVGINVFHILAFILGLGFSIDYSIFRLKGDKNSSLAVFISSTSTVFSFLLLSFTGFKLISSLGLVLSVGIFSSYILSVLLISSSSGADKENI